jgi:ABC-type amino acid transport substrate-binding protein
MATSLNRKHAPGSSREVRNGRQSRSRRRCSPATSSLAILSAYPDPPFDIMKEGVATGFDIELMRAVCGRLSLELRPLAYTGDDFNDIFAELAQRTCDAVISGTTITAERGAIVRFSRPYLEFNHRHRYVRV